MSGAVERVVEEGLIRKIREQRIRLGLTQQEVADLAGTSASVISWMETGKHSPTLQMLCRVGDALDMELMWWAR